MIMLYGIRLAHPALNLGWVAMSAYLAVYPLLFIGLTRVALHRLRLSVVLAAPIVWTGMELARGHAITGFSMALLGHTQVRWTTLIQISDIFGAYGVSFVVMLVAASVARSLPMSEGLLANTARRFTLWPLLTAAILLVAVLGYGGYRSRESDASQASDPVLRVALVQCSFDTSYEYDPKRNAEMLGRCLELSRKALGDHPSLDLIVWPESTLTVENAGDLVVEGERIPAEDDPFCTEYQKKTRQITALLNERHDDVRYASPRRVHLLAGTGTLHLGPRKRRIYNSALFIAPDGEVLGRYYKMHLVPFGEYLLLGDIFPWLYRLTPIAQGLAPGENPTVFELAGTKMAPSICFESTVPHLIRWQVASLKRSGKSPDLLVNVTNDGWFKGASILDYHLACAVFRGVENRLPVLVAANTGFSAFVDADGKIVEQGPRRLEDVIYAEVRRDGRQSWYHRLGDLPAGMCLLFSAALPILWGLDRLRRLKRGKRRE